MSTTQHEAAFNELIQPGRWVMFPVGLLRILNSRDSVVLAELINLMNLADEDGWFFCTRDRLNERLCMSVDSQKRAFENLKVKGLIEIDLQGKRKRRRVRVITSKIAECLQQTSSQRGAKSPPQGGRNRTPSNNEERTVEETNSQTSPPEEVRERDDIPSFGEELCPIGDFDACVIAWQEQLAAALKAKGCIKRRIAKTKWLTEFQRLLGSTEEDLISRVLNWYCRNIKGPFVPHAFSASSFRTKFPSIQAAYEKSTDAAAFNVDEMTDTEKRIFQQVSRGTRWPNGSERQLSHLVHDSLENLKSYREALKAIKTRDARPRVQRFARHVLQDIWRNPSAFVISWIKEVHGSVSDWKEWSGTFGADHFISIDSKRFDRKMRNVSLSFSSSEKPWETVKESIVNEG